MTIQYEPYVFKGDWKLWRICTMDVCHVDSNGCVSLDDISDPSKDELWFLIGILAKHPRHRSNKSSVMTIVTDGEVWYDCTITKSSFIGKMTKVDDKGGDFIISLDQSLQHADLHADPMDHDSPEAYIIASSVPRFGCGYADLSPESKEVIQNAIKERFG